MTFTITKVKLAVAIVVMALLAPATALAVHSWPDVDDSRFYADAVAWAKANGMTTGCDGGTAFCPDRTVTRGENITFAKRYDDFVVQPALADRYTKAETDTAIDAILGLTVHTVIYRIKPTDTGKFQGSCASPADTAVGGTIYFPEFDANFENRPIDATTAGIGNSLGVGAPVIVVSLGEGAPRPANIDIALVSVCTPIDYSTAIVIEP